VEIKHATSEDIKRCLLTVSVIEFMDGTRQPVGRFFSATRQILANALPNAHQDLTIQVSARIISMVSQLRNHHFHHPAMTDLKNRITS